MIIKDEHLLGGYTMRLLMDNKIDVFEEDGKHANQLNNITEAMRYVMNRRIVEMGETLSLKEYFNFIDSYSKELQDVLPKHEAV